MNRTTTGSVTLLAICIVLAGCATSTAGNKKLNDRVYHRVTEGETTKYELAEWLGHPRSMMNCDGEGICDVLYHAFLIRPPEEMFPDAAYEVWEYWKAHVTAGAVPVPIVGPSRSNMKQTRAIFVFDADGVCVKKFTGKESEADWHL